MWRFLAGVGSALLMTGAGFVWWSNSGNASSALAGIASPPARSTGASSTQPPEAEERTREEKRFDRYDKDRDQQITAEEYLANRRKAYARLDANGDGRLSFEEWSKKTTDKFARADGDASKALSREEFETTKVVRKAPARNCPPARDEEDS